MTSKASEISQQGKRLTRNYPTTCVVVLLYMLFVILNLVLVSYEWAQIHRTESALRPYDDGLSGLFIRGYFLLLFTFQIILFAVGAVMALITDRRRSKVGMAQTARPINITIVSIFLLLPALWIYGINYWSLWHDIAFQITAGSQQKLNRAFVEDVLNWGYNRTKIEGYLNKGADVNLLGYHGTPLILATQAEDEEFVNELLARGANVNATDGQRKTALAYALEDAPKQHQFSARRRRIVLSLIQHTKGSKIGSGDDALNTAIRFNRDKELLARLIDAGASLDKTDRVKFLSEALIAAAYAGNNYAVSELLDRGADVNYRRSMNTPLTNASHFETARLLVSRGANVNITDQNGASALMLAARCKSPKFLDMLIKAGASVSAQDNYSESVLSVAARTGDISRVRRLISLGAKIDPQGLSGKRALAAAIDANSPEMVKLFIDLGVNVNGAFYGGDGTLLKKAAAYNPYTKPEIIHLLREAGARE